jgi:cytochrome d ubiquinol oxidase subunit I
MELDALLLSRIQFAFTIGYHILFPTLSMGLAMFLLVLESLERKTGDPRYLQAWHFWTKIFSLSFGMGVVSGVVLSYEISNNFGRFSEIAGPVVGPLMSYEVLSAFFLEAGFLGIMLLGRQRVGPRAHWFATCMVAFGTLMSAFWILSANSFMHTPAGFRIVEGVLHVESWTKVIFNPSFPYRFLHMVTAAYLTTSFVVIGTGAWYLLQKQHQNFGRHMLKLGLTAAAVLAPLQIFLGDEHGLNTLEYQPIKVAAMEGHWRNEGPVPLLLFAIPDQAAEKNHFELAVPKLGSLILTHKSDGVIRGLTEVPAEDRPHVATVFWAFRVMVGCGLLMLGQAWLGLWLHRRNKLENHRWLLRAMVMSGPIGFIAVLAGWTVTECGRQPWVVHGLLRTRDASSLLPGAAVGFTLLAFVIVYSVLLVAFLIFLRHLIRKGPSDHVATTLESSAVLTPGVGNSGEGQ